MNRARQLAAALLLVIAAAGIARILHAYDVPHSSPPYLLAVMLAALYGGRTAGIFATALATLAAAYFDFAPAYSLRLGLDDLVRLAAFTTAALVMSAVSAARVRAESELRAALDALSKLDRAKDEFLATVSHELRTPLTSISGWLQILREPGTDDETRALALESIEQSTRTQRMLVDDLLDVSRIVVGKLHIAAQPIDLRTVIAAAIDVVRPSAEQQQVALSAVLPETPLAIVGDPGRLQQVIWNLLTNALRFTPAGGMVHVEAESSAREIVVRVRDTGSGIEEELLPVIFDRFRQGSAHKGGLGLGLSISKEIVSLHGGSIAAANRREGGAEFIVILPRPVSASAA